jgi:hypothetical protein
VRGFQPQKIQFKTQKSRPCRRATVAVGPPKKNRIVPSKTYCIESCRLKHQVKLATNHAQRECLSELLWLMQSNKNPLRTFEMPSIKETKRHISPSFAQGMNKRSCKVEGPSLRVGGGGMGKHQINTDGQAAEQPGLPEKARKRPYRITVESPRRWP